MLRLRRATVAVAGPPDAVEQRLAIHIGDERRTAIADVALVGAVAGRRRDHRQRRGGRARARLRRRGHRARQPHARPRRRRHAGRARDEAQLHEPAARGAAGRGGRRRRDARRRSRCRCAGPSPCSRCTASSRRWRGRSARPRTAAGRLGYVQTAGGALPGGHSCVVRELRAGGMLAGHLTAGPAFGGADGEAITTAAALHHGLHRARLGRRGRRSRARHPRLGLARSATAACRRWTPRTRRSRSAAATLLVARMSSTDPRARHRGMSHHTRTVLDLLLAPVVVAIPEGEAAGRRAPRVASAADRPRRVHRQRPADALDGARGSAVLRRRAGGRRAPSPR